MHGWLSNAFFLVAEHIADEYTFFVLVIIGKNFGVIKNIKMRGFTSDSCST